MGLDALLTRAVSVLERLDLRYFVTGSMAAIYYGEPRYTRDIDLVVDLPERLAKVFCAAFPAPEFYVEIEAVRDAIRRRSQFNIVETSTGLKIDVMLPDGEFDQTRLARAIRAHPKPEIEASFITPEDLILKKLDFYREGESDKHLRDIGGILDVSGAKLDYDYLNERAERLELSDLWRAVQSRHRTA